MWLILLLRSLSPDAGQYAHIIQQESERVGLDPRLVAAIIYKESKFKNGKCFRGSHGLMQIQLKPRSCKRSMAEAKRRGLYDPRKNIRRGVELAAWWKNWWRRFHKDDGYHWLLHYNQGFGRCADGGFKCAAKKRVPVTTGVRGRYADRVLKIYRKLKRATRRTPARLPSGAEREAVQVVL
jgi:membrane-bound lytic murein transglycosylase MltF